MSAIISNYLDTIRAGLKLDSSRQQEVLNELASHIEDELDELREKGLSEDEAAQTCIRLFGSAKQIARQIYEAHSQGSWKHALFASSPHLLFCLLFALNWWQGIGVLMLLVAVTATVAIYGWWHGKPTWLFPWLGYVLLPLITVGLFLLYLPAGWTWVAFIIYIPLTLWLLSRVIRQTQKLDWIYTSLMLFPIPVVVSWFMAIKYGDLFSPHSFARLQYFSPWIGLSFLAIAIAAASFIRLRNRWWKIASISVTGTVTIVLIACISWRKLDMPMFVGLVIFMIGIFLIPAWIESKPGIPGVKYRPSARLSRKGINEKSSGNY